MEGGDFNTRDFFLMYTLIWLRNDTDETILILYVMCKQIHIKHHLEQILFEKSCPFLSAMGHLSVSLVFDIIIKSYMETERIVPAKKKIYE